MLEFLNNWLPIDASAHGAELDSMTALVHWLMAVLFVGWGPSSCSCCSASGPSAIRRRIHEA